MNNSKGTVFLSTMIAMLLMILTGEAMYLMADQGVYAVKRLRLATQAKHLADSGLAIAFASLAGNFVTSSTWNGSISGFGGYTATASTSSGRTLVVATGTVQGVTVTSSAEVTPPSADIMDYSLAGSNVDFYLAAFNMVTATGSIYSEGNMTLDANATTSVISLTSPGNVNAGGTITVTGSGLITMGTATSNASLASYPTVDFAYYQNLAQNGGGTYVNGDVTYNSSNAMPSPAGGVIYVNGNVSITSDQTSTAALIVNGNLSISRGATTIVAPANLPAIVTQGAITISGIGANAADLTVTGLIYSGNDFTITGNHHNIMVTYGAIIARGNFVGNSSGFSQSALTIIYPTTTPAFSLNGITSGGSSQMAVESYNR
ncbi:MAG: hypothetical protein HY592_02760 [Candidatus Omnitrophica bacterium]|nr:hypothetical protein [Candidatus Omnitrophota bacterium]